MSVLVGFFTDAWHHRVLDATLRGVPLTPPTLVLGLSRNKANRSGTLSEVPTAGTGYARQTIGPTTFAPAAAGATSNAVAITFPEPTASWGTVRSLFLFDTTSNQVIAMADLAAEETILAGEPAVTFVPGAILISRS